MVGFIASTSALQAPMYNGELNGLMLYLHVGEVADRTLAEKVVHKTEQAWRCNRGLPYFPAVEHRVSKTPLRLPTI